MNFAQPLPCYRIYIFTITSEFHTTLCYYHINSCPLLPHKQLPLAVLVRQVYWWWTPSAFLCSKNSICPSFLKNSFAGYRILGWLFPPFYYLNISYYYLLAWKIHAERYVGNLMKIHMYINLFFCFQNYLWFLTI